MTQTTNYKPRVLCVDDEPNVLEGLIANLRRRYRVQTATSGALGLQAIEDAEEPFEAVVSDMQMPGMDGAAFLSEVRRCSPDTTRILLTGHAELSAAVAAVNDGGVFRFLTKPCPPAQLIAAVGDACRQFQLRKAERELLEETLKGTVSVLSEVMSLAAPLAFGRANRIRRTVRWTVEMLGLEDAWQYELAAMLSQIGLVGVDESLIMKATGHEEVPTSEKQAFQEHAEVARRMLQRIPRLESIAAMVGGQCRDTTLQHAVKAVEQGDAEKLGAHILRAALDLDARMGQGEEPSSLLLRMRGERDVYNPTVVEAMRQAYEIHGHPDDRVRIDELKEGMILLEPVCTLGGSVVVPKGYEITKTVKASLVRFAAGRGLREPVMVQLPEEDARLQVPKVNEVVVS
ncbi:MAG: response regulator [Myxococcota bacterium]